jgi:signal transduction histidine kinase
MAYSRLPENLDFRAILDALGQGILIFDPAGDLVMDNLRARTMLANNLILIREEGWSACALLLDAKRGEGTSLDELRSMAYRQAEPVRFRTFLGGAFIPCWVAAIHAGANAIYTMIVLENPDWTALTELMSTFRTEARMAITSTRGHAELVSKLIRRRQEGITVEQLAQRILGFSEVMITHMYRLDMLMHLLERLEIIRTNRLDETISPQRIELYEFIEDFVEDVEDLTDPSEGEVDFRDRLTVDVPDDLELVASKLHLHDILRDVLRNAVMYSDEEKPIEIRALSTTHGQTVQIDVVDQGIGIRDSEHDRVFAPFKRARQPRVIAEFGFGLSLYLCRIEMESMDGRIWFDSNEGVGTTFSIKLPAWTGEERDDVL